MKIFYAIENLRSLESTPKIELRPITVLVGRNSAGKSTLLRSLALLRQSLESRSSAPVLWYGDYVDFGDFSSAVHNRDTNKQISFDFSAEDVSYTSRDLSYEYSDPRYLGRSRRVVEYEKIRLKISLGEQLGRTIRKSILLEIPEHNITLLAKFGKSGLYTESFQVNGVELSDLLPSHNVYFEGSNIFSSGSLTQAVRVDSRQVRRYVSPLSAFASYVTSLVKPHVDKRILASNIEREARRILRNPTLDQRSLHILSASADTASFQRLYASLASDKHPDLFDRINIASATYYTLQTLSDTEDLLRQFFLATTYLGPARARSERYYRFQELEVSEIAPDGNNLPMFLGSLTPSNLSRFSDWVENLFGFGVGVQRNEGHISIQLRRKDLDVNIADTGYGVSQMLPVLAQIWWSSRSNHISRRPSRHGKQLYPITMEQPELHLHPAHQAKLADALLNALPEVGDDDSGSPVFLVETHSETLINRLGELIEQGDLSAEDVQVVVFSTDGDDGNSTRISTSEYDEDGVLKNWPFGFFSY